MIVRTIKQNKTLKNLLITILFLGFFAEIVGLLFTNQPIHFTISMWVGVLAAMCMAIQMGVTLEYAMDLGEHESVKYMIKHNMIRYGIVVILFGIVLLLSDVLNPLYTFGGIMTLKVGAYLEPFTDKLLSKTKSK